MDVAVSMINALSSALIAVALITAVLSKRVHDGVVIKVGLCSTALGFIVMALHMLKIRADPQGLERALLLINSGIAVVILGYLFRQHSVGHSLRRITDWADIDSPETRPGSEKGSMS